MVKFRFENNYIYEYEYDKYGNWVVKYEFLIPYNKEEQNYKNFISVIMRELSYKNGDTIEDTFVDNKTVQNYIKKEDTNWQLKIRRHYSKKSNR